MATKTLKTVPKISVKIWRPIIARLDEKLDAACLRRDAYLTKVLEVELNYLDKEVSIPNSKESYEYVFDRLDRLDRKLVSLALPQNLTARLNEICSRKRIVRDAFFNRLFLLLAASPDTIASLLFKNDPEDWDWRQEVWSEHRNDGPFFQNSFHPLEPEIDPFWAIRIGLELYANAAGLKDRLYTTYFEKTATGIDLNGMNCYLPDRRIPGHVAERDHFAELNKLFGDIKWELS